MATVDAGYAAWLKTSARLAVATISGAAAAWGAKAQDTTVTSSLAYKADAQAEAVVQADFLAGPIVKDAVVVPGLRRDLIGKVVTLKGDRFGYEGAGDDVFVIGVAENGTTQVTTLTVLKRL